MEISGVRIPIRFLTLGALLCACIATFGTAPAVAQSSGPPVKGSAPVIKGKAREGGKLKATAGSWAGAQPISHAFTWERCDSSGEECAPIPGAETNVYRATTTDVGHRLVALVKVSNGEGSAEARTAPSAVIAPVAPKHVGKATLSGQAVDGRVLDAGTGHFKGTPPFTYSYTWTRCAHRICTVIAGAERSTYRVTTQDIGAKLKATIVASNTAGSGSQHTKPTAKVLPGSPVNLAAPHISGTPLIGQTLTADEGTWAGTPTITYGYQWFACSPISGCEEISGANGQTHEVGVSELGDSFKVKVTATNAEGSASAESEETNATGGEAPSNTEAPAISGTPTAGQLLTASSGKWSGTEPITYEYEWLRCNAEGGECAQAAAPSVLPVYLAAGTDAGHTLRVRVIATNLAGKGEAESAPTALIAGVAPENHIAPLVLGLDITGQTLTASEGTWTGTEPITYAFRWQQCSKGGTECADIGGASESKYTIADTDAGHTLRVVVTAKNIAGTVEKESAVTGEVIGVGPKNTEAPAISGTPTAGQLLTASSGKWSGTEPIAYEYEWLRCNAAGSECVQAAAPSLLPTYSVAGADVGHKLRVKVLAKNIAGSGSAESEPTATVAGVAPENKIAPLVLGLDITGQTLTASEGTWTGTEPITYSYRWQRCSKTGTECTSIEGEGATKSTYVIQNGDAGHTLRVVVTAKNVAGSVAKESAVTGEVLGVGPKNTEAPSISGEAKEGQLLTASSGKWSGTEPITFEYEWLRCNTAGASCAQASGASLLPTYTAVAADVGKTLRVKVLAKNLAGTESAESEKTEPVKGVPPTNTVLPVTVPLVSTTSGSTVTATEGTWTGTQPITYHWVWKICTTATSCKLEQEGTSSSFKVPASSGGKKLRVNVIATNAAGSGEKEALELSILI